MNVGTKVIFFQYEKNLQQFLCRIITSLVLGQARLNKSHCRHLSMSFQFYYTGKYRFILLRWREQPPDYCYCYTGMRIGWFKFKKIHKRIFFFLLFPKFGIYLVLGSRRDFSSFHTQLKVKILFKFVHLQIAKII